MSQAERAALQQRIHRHIPLSREMDFAIEALEPTGIVVSAPLEPNVNIHGTAFAGSIYAIGALAAWALGTHILDRAALTGMLVIARASIEYRAPVTDSIHCRCRLTADQARAFVADLRTRGRSRVTVQVEIGDGPAALLQAELHVQRTEA